MKGSKIGRLFHNTKRNKPVFVPRRFKAIKSLDDFLLNGDIMIEVYPNIIRQENYPMGNIGIDLRIFEKHGGIYKWFQQLE